MLISGWLGFPVVSKIFFFIGIFLVVINFIFTALHVYRENIRLGRKNK